MKKKRFPMVKELIRKFKAWAIDKFTPGTTDSMKKLEELSKTEKSIEHYENNEPVNNIISESITEFKQILTGILRKHLSELQKINSSTNNDELQKKIDGIIAILDQIEKINEKNFNTESKKLFESSKEILKKPSITQRFKQGFSNMGKTVKNAATSAKGAVTSRFSRKNKSGEEKGLELQEVNNNPEQQSTPTETKPTETKPTETTPSKTTPNTTQEMDPLSSNIPVQAAGGNKTRKNRQYIREIKDNRAHLFNKEMEIINSIRNFKYGHIHEPKKQFIRAVKRS
jgi:hypothetical protein